MGTFYLPEEAIGEGDESSNHCQSYYAHLDSTATVMLQKW